MLAKRAKDYYQSEECKLLHHLFEVCFTKPLFSGDEKLCIRFLDLMNVLLATEREPKTRRYLVYTIQDK